MFPLNILRARHLSRQGRHTAALALCGMADRYVLSRAGMHLSVLERAAGPSIEHALALVRLGDAGAALEMARRYAGKVTARTLLGQLAVEAPDAVLQVVSGQKGLDDIKAYCAWATGAADQGAFDRTCVSPLHLMLLALKGGRLEGARDQFDRMFGESGLDVPNVTWRPSGIDYASLSCVRFSRPVESETRVSVILTAHNEESLLHVAVDSLLAQSWRNLEIVLVDDASTDRTWDVAQALARKDGRIKPVKLDRQLGLWGAKNAGLEHCTGGIVTMHDADDWSHCRKIELQVQPLLRSRGLVATSSYMVRVDQHTGAPYTRNARNFVRWNPSSFMFRTDLVRQQGGFLDKLLGSDCEFVARAETVYGVDSHLHVRLPLSIGLQRGGSLSNRFRSGAEALVRFQHWEQWRQRHVRGELQGPAVRPA